MNKINLIGDLVFGCVFRKSELFFLCQLIANYKNDKLPQLKEFVQLSHGEIEHLHSLLWSAYEAD